VSKRFISQPAGVTGSAKAGYQLALNKNGVYVANISAALRGIPKRVVGALAATTLVEAINATKHDSSRAAANWELALFREKIRTTLSPAHYEQENPRWGVTGSKGDKGFLRDVVLDYMKMWYGIAPGVGKWYEPNPKGLLGDALGIHDFSPTPTIELFNPILGSAHLTRGAGGDHSGSSYAYYAFSGGDPQSFMAGLGNAKQLIGNGYLPHLIKQLASQIKGSNTRGTFRR